MKTATTATPGRRLLPLATAALLGTIAPAKAGPRFVMEIRDHEGNIAIAGESDAPGHEGAIEVVSFGKGFSASHGFPPMDTTGIKCGILVDKALPKLAAAATARGSSIAMVDLFYLGDGSLPTGNEAAHMRLEHVQITGLTVGHGIINPLGPAFASGEVPVAQLSLNFSQVSWIYQSLDGAGGVASETSTTHTAFAPTDDPGFDDDNDGLSNAEDDDDDNDSVPDPYEVSNGLNPFADDSEGDKDGDRQSNRNEWVTNTRADDATSFYKIDRMTFRKTPQGPTGSVSFAISEGRRYRLLATPSLALPKEHWTVLDAFEVPPGSPETAADVDLQPAVLGNAAKLFFEVEVRMISPAP